MEYVIGNAIVGQSGGPTSAINATLAGVILGAKSSPYIGKLFGSLNGIEGIISENIVDISKYIGNDKDVDKLIQTPGSFLKCCRYKLPDMDQNIEVYNVIFETFKKNNIRYFFYIGGNDSMDTVKKLSDYAKKIDYKINIIGIPKTVDNDLAETDHTPGFGSAAKYVAVSIKELSRDINSFSMPYVLVVEVMGRNTGWLTASSALARGSDCIEPDLIYLPEIPFNTDTFISDIQKTFSKKNTVLVVVSEGIKYENGSYVYENVSNEKTDEFGHNMLGGSAKVLVGEIERRLGCKARAVELNIVQRSASHILSKTDIEESIAIGKKAVEFSNNDKKGIMVTLKRINNNPYEVTIDYEDINKIANIEKKVPRNWINEDGNYINIELYNYLKPLIQGEYNIIYEDGLPAHIKI